MSPLPALPTGRHPVRIWGINSPDLSGELVGLGEGLLRVRSEGRLENSSRATISFGRIQLSGIVIGSQPDGDTWDLSIAVGKCRRREARLPARGTLAFGVAGPQGMEWLEGDLENVSASGLALTVPREIEIGVKVCVETVSEMLIGEVRHCRRRSNNRCSIGIMLTEIIPDSRSNELPIFWNQLLRKIGLK